MRGILVHISFFSEIIFNFCVTALYILNPRFFFPCMHSSRKKTVERRQADRFISWRTLHICLREKVCAGGKGETRIWRLASESWGNCQHLISHSSLLKSCLCWSEIQFFHGLGYLWAMFTTVQKGKYEIWNVIPSMYWFLALLIMLTVKL